MAACGSMIQQAPTAEDCPDSVFIEDTVVVCEELAVLARPGQHRPAAPRYGVGLGAGDRIDGDDAASEGGCRVRGAATATGVAAAPTTAVIAAAPPPPPSALPGGSSRRGRPGRRCRWSPRRRRYRPGRPASAGTVLPPPPPVQNGGLQLTPLAPLAAAGLVDELMPALPPKPRCAFRPPAPPPPPPTTTKVVVPALMTFAPPPPPALARNHAVHQLCPRHLRGLAACCDRPPAACPSAAQVPVGRARGAGSVFRCAVSGPSSRIRFAPQSAPGCHRGSIIASELH